MRGKILGTLFSIIHSSTPPPTTTSIINVKQNYHLSDNVNKKHELKTYEGLLVIYEVAKQDFKLWGGT